MSDVLVPSTRLGLLMRAKLRIAANQVRHASLQSPIKVAAAAVLLCSIWYGLYWLFVTLFQEFQRSVLESVVAAQLIFDLFFGALLVMLAFSNAIILYGLLFNQREAAYLLTCPVPPGAVVTMKYLESLLFSSWALILLGLPLMVAMARTSREPWFFYPLFLALFLGFIPIPAGLGLIAAWVAARCQSPRRRRPILLMGGVLVVAVMAMGLRELRNSEGDLDYWLHTFLVRMDFLQMSILPSTWVSRALERLMHGREYGEAMLYLASTVSTGLFISWLGIAVVSRRFLRAFDAAANGADRQRRRIAPPVGGVAGAMFFYLPRPMRMIAAKDLRTFIRDPLQWSQLAILFGLMGLYLINIPAFHLDLASANWGWLVPLLNLSAVALIVATFTSRFVFPLISLEGNQLWVLGLLPFPRRNLAWAKFAFAMTVTVPIGLATTAWASIVLEVPRQWALIHLGVVMSLSVALCGIATGIGARLPSFGEQNPARIANGLGGTISLIASVAVVVVMLAGLASLGLRTHQLQFMGHFDGVSCAILATVLAVGWVSGLVTLKIGANHLERIDV